MAGNAGGIAGGDPARSRSTRTARAARMPVRGWAEPAPPTATAVVKATACAGSRTGRSAGAVSCFSVRKVGAGGGRMHRLRHCQPATALTVIMAFHHRSVGPQARQACSGRGHPVNDSEVTERHRQPVTALTVIMALHHHPSNRELVVWGPPQGTSTAIWPRAPCHAWLCDQLSVRASPLHCGGGRRGVSSAFAEPLTVHSLASAATLSTAPTRGSRGPVSVRVQVVPLSSATRRVYPSEARVHVGSRRCSQGCSPRN